MAPWVWVVIVVVALVVIVGLVVMTRQRRTAELQRQFGPEYDRAVVTAEGRRAGEAELTERARRRSELRIVPLSEPDRRRYAEQWHAVQEEFVDRPAQAVASAEAMLSRVMEQRGYPVSDFEEQADLVSVDHPQLVNDYREAHAIHTRNASGQASTEDLREALLRYRSLFDELLRPQTHGEERPQTRTVAEANAEAEAGADTQSREVRP